MKKILNWVDAVTAVLALLWFVVPVTASPAGAGLTGTALQSLLSSGADTGLWGAVLLLGWLVPVLAVYRVAGLFVPASLAEVANPLGWSASALRLVVGVVLLLATLVPFTLWGASSVWYTTLPATLWVVFALGLVLSAFGFYGLIESLNHSNPDYAQYQEFRKSHRSNAEQGTLLVGLRRIRSKLLIAFIGIIVVILVILSSNLLQSYQTTILKAVGDGARSGVEQASTTYKVNLGSSIAMGEFLQGQNRINDRAAFPFQSIEFYTDVKSTYLLDKKTGSLPTLKVEFSSQYPDFEKDKDRIAALPGLTADQVRAFLDPASAAGLHDAAAGTYSYAATITTPEFEKDAKGVDVKDASGKKIRHDRLVGLAVVTFREDVILAPYVQTRTIVLILTFLFLYVAIGLVFLVGNLIVNPLLYLRMNVRHASDSLEAMIRGEIRVSAAALNFNDTVHTKDEIKTLSGEIGNMVTVIRGIIPYISASTLKQAEKGTALSERKNLTFLFTDIRGFTTMSEGMSPEEVVQVLNRYLDLETEIILQNHGDVDKFVGDEMMAFFDGPDKELNACRAAMQIRKAMFDEKVLREKQGLPSVEIGIGINTGDVVFGSMGARERMDFTSIGDTVNLAARLEGANKAYSSKSMIAESVYLKVKDKFVCRELDFIAVKGKTEPVRIYEILQEKEKASPKLAEISKLFGEALEAYRAKAWNTASELFERLVIEYKDGPAEVFLGRVHHFEKNPPPQEWDGVFRMDVK